MISFKALFGGAPHDSVALGSGQYHLGCPLCLAARSHAWRILTAWPSMMKDLALILSACPVTSAPIFPSDLSGLSMAGAWFFAWVWLGLSLLTFLFVYNCRIPKPNKLAYLVFAILAVASLIVWGSPHG